ncbi:hypothetical protein Poly30_55580 [Planctomycetes bacterium Poly30]|uniref:Uncharacterized protein n=2 Tax=Saltatorellus ferox TaxID=2528018 RepID=A0A518F0Z4_9BACT|nr:hypothetical protein Poly30_55580 [Planctomycetes bacterium Poly30]
MILSLYWSKMTARGSLVAMIVGFLCVPLFKFGAPELAVVGDFFGQLGELPPAFLLSGLAGVATSLMDRKGGERVLGAASDIDHAAG